MAKREPPETKITTFFQTAEAVNAIAMYTAVKSILLSRGFELDGRKTAQKKPREPKGAGKKTPALNEPTALTDEAQHRSGAHAGLNLSS